MPLTGRTNAGWLALTVLALAACRTPEPEASPQQAQRHVEADHRVEAPPSVDPPVFGPHHSPLLVTLNGPEQPAIGQDIEVVAQVDQTLGQGRNLSLELQLPPGARLVAGKTSELVAVGQGKLERRFVVHLDDMPKGDIEVVASTNQRSFGARAKGSYRFGRPEPRLPAPKRAAQPVYVSGRNVGHPIELR